VNAESPNQVGCRWLLKGRLELSRQTSLNTLAGATCHSVHGLYSRNKMVRIEITHTSYTAVCLDMITLLRALVRGEGWDNIDVRKFLDLLIGFASL
jgi:hypothetical protein